MRMKNRTALWFAAGLGVLILAGSCFWLCPPSMIQADSEQPASAASLELLESTARVFENVAVTVSPAVVYIEARSYSADKELHDEESGSGVLFRPDGADRSLVLTNCHVLGKAKVADIDIHLSDGRLCHPTKIHRDEATDLAILDPGLDLLPAAKLGDSNQARIGQWVLVIGSPFGLCQSVTHGIVSATHRRRLGLPGDVRNQEFLQTDAPINPGNSGGPLVNLNGEVIGINTAIASRTGASSGVGFSIPINLAKWVIVELLQHGQVRRGFLGIEFPNLFEHETAVALGLEVNRGALVSRVHPRTPADLAGIRADDVILQYNGIPVEDEYHLINLVSQTPVGQEVEIQIWRGREKTSLHATLSSWQNFQEQARATTK